MVKFSCEADANPGVGTYRLYKNGDMIANMAGSGVLIRTLNTGGQFNCRCEASNSVGTGTSNNITLIVKGELELVLLQCFSIFYSCTDS